MPFLYFLSVVKISQESIVIPVSQTWPQPVSFKTGQTTNLQEMTGSYTLNVEMNFNLPVSLQNPISQTDTNIAKFIKK